MFGYGHADPRHGPFVMEAQPKRRTKSGCLTCRKRRIKCDELYDDMHNMVCRNCIKTRRICIQPPPTTAEKADRDPGFSNHPGHPGDGLPFGNELYNPGEAVAPNLHIDSTFSHPSQGEEHGHGSVVDVVPMAIPECEPPLPFVQHFPAYEGGPQTFNELELMQTRPGSDPPDNAPFGVMHLAAAPHTDLGAVLESSQFPFQVPIPPHSNTMPLEDMSPQHWPSSSSSSFRTADILQRGDSQSDLSHSQSVELLHGDQHEPVRRATFRDTTNESTITSSAQLHPLYLEEPATSLSFVAPPKSHLEPRGAARLTQRQSSRLKYFIEHVDLNFTAFDDSFYLPSEGDAISSADFWGVAIPSLAVHSVPLLHAVFAIAALHESNVHNSSEHEALLEYNQSIRELAHSFREPDARLKDDVLATCLILAYYETMSGETMKWGRHLKGAADLVKARIKDRYMSGKHLGRYVGSPPSFTDHLVWFYIHQDSIQSLLSGKGLFLDLHYFEACRERGAHGSIINYSDQLRVLLARTGHFISKDRARKEAKATDEITMQQAISDWEQLLSSIYSWRNSLSAPCAPFIKHELLTPFGTAICFSNPGIASFQMMSLAAILCLHRAHPSLSTVPAEAVRSSAAATHTIGQDLIRMLDGVMAQNHTDRTTEPRLHIKAMINAVLPVLLAAIALQDPYQRDHVEMMLFKIYSLTGWRTALKVVQGLDVAWKRPPKEFKRMPTTERQVNIQRQDESLERAGTILLPMDKLEALDCAAGVLGKLQIVDPTHHPSQPEYDHVSGYHAEPQHSISNEFLVSRDATTSHSFSSDTLPH